MAIAKKKAAKNSVSASAELIKALRSENRYLKRRIKVLEEREFILVDRLISVTTVEEDGDEFYNELTQDWMESRDNAQKTFGVKLPPTDRTSINSIVKREKAKHEAKVAANLMAQVELEKAIDDFESEAERKPVEVRLSEATKNRYIETAKSILEE